MDKASGTQILIESLGKPKHIVLLKTLEFVNKTPQQLDTTRRWLRQKWKFVIYLWYMKI